METYPYEQEFCDKARIQQKYDSPMPLIGVYIAAASLVCSLAMAADVIHGVRRRKLWFPCKFFTMNAASLTVLAVAMKLPVDLTTAMWGRTDKLAKLSSNIFMTTVMGNFSTSLASMDNNAIFLNITALGILVVTIIVNICIQIRNSVIDQFIWAEEILVIISTFVLFLTLASSALTIPTTKRYLDLKYSELHKTTSNAGKFDEIGKLTNQELKEVVEKYWVMAETGSPQFVMVRSVTGAMSGVISLLTALTLVEVVIRMELHEDFVNTDSNYQWSTSWILWIQFSGVMVGTVAPVFRWFTAINFNFSKGDGNNHQNGSKLLENYWIQSLVEWKERPLNLRIHSVKCRKLVEDTKKLFLDLCIGIQLGIVVVCKAVRFISLISISPLLSCYIILKRNLISEPRAPAPAFPENSNTENLGKELDLSDYVLQLEGEAKLPKRILNNIRHDLNQTIQKGKRKPPKNLMELLWKSNDRFNGVARFDSSQVPHILPESPPNCWTLTVVTLTSLAIALPNIENHVIEKLISSVSEGLLYAGLVEESLRSIGDDLLKTIKQAADVLWVGVELHRKWMNLDLQKLAAKGKTSKETLQGLADTAEKTIIIELRKSMRAGILMENPLNWPVKVIAANSMYRISQTTLRDYESATAQTDENLFTQLSTMIADILGACLTNLQRVILLKCYCSAIEERERSVRHAACLLGETEKILEILRDRAIPSLDGDRVAFIDEWRACMELENRSAFVASSNHEIAGSGSGELHIAMDE